MHTFSLAPLILYLPLAGLLFNGLFGRRFVDSNRTTGERLTGWLATLMTLGAFVVSWSKGVMSLNVTPTIGKSGTSTMWVATTSARSFMASLDLSLDYRFDFGCRLGWLRGPVCAYL